jgi:dihydropteroate synthase
MTTSFKLSLKDKKIILNSNVCLIGIVNITPDSFYDGGYYIKEENAIERIHELISNGASIIDIGGESSRPNSQPITIENEIDRILPVLRAIKGKVEIPISVDTYKSEVARIALEEGADIINDISAMRFDPKLPEIVAKYKAGLILMHMQGTPKNMQENPKYQDVIKEIHDFLQSRIEFAISNGIKKESIMIDPGIGFGKTLEHNLTIIKNIDKFKNIGYPIVIGPSRKSFIGMVTGKEPEKRLFGTAGVVSYCAMKGVNLIRVHDVDEMKDVVDLIHAIEKK